MNSKTLVHYFASFKRFFSDHILACDVSSRAIQNCIHCRFQSEKCYTSKSRKGKSTCQELYGRITASTAALSHIWVGL